MSSWLTLVSYNAVGADPTWPNPQPEAATTMLMFLPPAAFAAGIIERVCAAQRRSP
jgi:hypothetical protein